MKFPFIRQIFNSISNIEWLRTQRNNRSGAWAYYILFIFIVVCIQFLPGLWDMPREIHAIWNQTKRNVPAFEAHIDNGALDISGVEEPLVYAFSFDGEEGFVYINTATSTQPASVEEVFPEDIDFGIVVLKEKMTFIDTSGDVVETDSVFFSDVQDPISFDRDDLMQWGDRVATWVGRLLVPVLLFVGFVAIAVGRLVIVTISCFVAWVVARIAGKSWRYGELFHIGLFAVTLPSLIVTLLYSSGRHIPFLFSGLLLIILLLVVFNDRFGFGKNSMVMKNMQELPDTDKTFKEDDTIKEKKKEEAKQPSSPDPKDSDKKQEKK